MEMLMLHKLKSMEIISLFWIQIQIDQKIMKVHWMSTNGVQMHKVLHSNWPNNLIKHSLVQKLDISVVSTSQPTKMVFCNTSKCYF